MKSKSTVFLCSYLRFRCTRRTTNYFIRTQTEPKDTCDDSNDALGSRWVHIGTRSNVDEDTDSRGFLWAASTDIAVNSGISRSLSPCLKWFPSRNLRRNSGRLWIRFRRRYCRRGAFFALPDSTMQWDSCLYPFLEQVSFDCQPRLEQRCRRTESSGHRFWIILRWETHSQYHLHYNRASRHREPDE